MSEQLEVDRVKRRRGGKGKRRRRSSKPSCGVVKITRGPMAGRYRNTCNGHLARKPRR